MYLCKNPCDGWALTSAVNRRLGAAKTSVVSTCDWDVQEILHLRFSLIHNAAQRYFYLKRSLPNPIPYLISLVYLEILAQKQPWDHNIVLAN